MFEQVFDHVHTKYIDSNKYKHSVSIVIDRHVCSAFIPIRLVTILQLHIDAHINRYHNKFFFIHNKLFESTLKKRAAPGVPIIYYAKSESSGWAMVNMEWA